MADTSRILLYTPQDQPLGEITPELVFERIRTEVINGEHSLKLTTTRVLTKETRVLVHDDDVNIWREYVVMGEDADHASGKRAIGSYYAIWSLQHDLQITTVSREPGIQTPVTAGVALAAALSGTSRWTVGTVTQSTTGGASMYQRSGWEALGVLVDVWGGEIGVSIGVNSEGVVSRAVNLLSHEGSSTAVRRFDYSRDMTEIRRRVSEDPLYVRIIPLGKGEETEGGGYGRKIGIETATGNTSGLSYIENAESAAIYKLPDGQGGYEYPIGYVENSDIDDVDELYAWGLSVLNEWTTPRVTYDADVVSFAEAGLNSTGIALGDEVQCVDRAFAEDMPLRISGRVVKMVVNELNPSDATLTLGNLGEGLPDLFNQLQTTVKRTRDVALAAQSGTITTAEYLDNLIANLNTEINATGGYTYIIPGQGLRTYDAAVVMGTDPVTGEPIVSDDSMASAVVEIKGGTIRIANTKTNGQWNWRTVFTSGHVAAEVVTAANITTGYIGNANGDFFIDLDNHIYHMPAMAVGGTQLLDDTDRPNKLRFAAVADRYFGTLAGTTFTAEPNPDPPINGIKYLNRVTVTTTSSGSTGIMFYEGGVGLDHFVEGQTYTVSFWARRTSGTIAQAKINVIGSPTPTLTEGNYNIYTKWCDLTSVWTKYSYTFTYSSATLYQYLRINFVSYANATGVVEMCGYKLESGFNATDWCLSQNDLAMISTTAVGSTQLLDDTDAPTLNRVSSKYNRYFSDASNTDTTASIVPCPDPPIVGIQNMQRYVIGVAGSKHKNLVFYSNTSVDALPYEDGETYTVSCFARVTSGAKARIEMRCSAFGVSGTAGTITIDNTEWKQYSWTKVANSSSGLFRVFVGVYSTYAATVEICGIKCERGSNATDWCLSQNDLLQKSSNGENLLIDADAPTLTAVAALKNRYWSDASRGTDIVEPYLEACSDPPQVGINNKLRFVVKQVSTYKNLVFYSGGGLLDLIDGEDYTVSFWARKTSGTQVTINCRDTASGKTGAGGTSRNTTITNTAWQRYQWTFRWDATKNPYSLNVGVYCSDIGTLEICGIKLEKGVFATDWTKSVNNQIFTPDSQPIIFNQLTNYGQIQGLYMQNGQLYINSEYINTQALISPKVGNSSSDYAEVGTFTYLGESYSGISFKLNDTVGTMCLGVRDVPNEGTYVVLGIGLPDAYGYWPIASWSQSLAVISGLPVMSGNHYIAPILSISSTGVYAEYNGRSTTLCTF